MDKLIEALVGLHLQKGWKVPIQSVWIRPCVEAMDFCLQGHPKKAIASPEGSNLYTAEQIVKDFDLEEILDIVRSSG